MCGILYSLDSNGFTDLKFLKQRGPEDYTETSNELGYFVHSLLNTIGNSVKQPLTNNYGTLLYNGSTYNSLGKNDTNWIFENINGTLENTIDVIKTLNGEYALVYVTEKNVIFCVDQFDQRNLWFYHSEENRQFTVSSLPSVVQQKHSASWRVEGNKIYILDRQSFKIEKITNKVFDVKQTVNNFDIVFEKFEQAIKNRYNHSTCVNLLSSGFDSGVINCATFKIFDKVDCVTDPANEVKEVLKSRLKIHHGTVLPNFYKDKNDKLSMYSNLLPSNDIWQDPLVEALIEIIKNYVRKKNKKIILSGVGGDEIYNDWQGQLYNLRLSKSNGLFPESLDMIWPWYNYTGRLFTNTIRMDLLCGFYGVEVRNPLLDVELVQSWLNTTNKLKNQGYKSWMKIYMDQHDYPYTMKKVQWRFPEYSPIEWKPFD